MVCAMYKRSSFPISTAKPLTMGRLTYGKFFLFIYCILFLGSSLGAYNIAFVPIEWLTKVGLITTVIFIAGSRKLHLYTVPGVRIVLFFFLWALLITAGNILLKDYASMMPPLATTPYPIFISLRFVHIIHFIAALYVIYWLLVNGYKDSVIKWTVIIGMVVALLAIYIYLAQIYGFPEPPRTRMSTGGQTDPFRLVRFSYAFHRATGTFREPSHLAEWLVVPFFLGMIYSKNFINICSIVIGTTILLTGSLTGIMGLFLGIMGTILIANPFKSNPMKTLVRVLFLGGITLVLFNMIALSYSGGKADIIGVVGDRIGRILFEGGMEESSRSYIYEYISDTTIPFFGQGEGNANIVFAYYLGSSLPVAFNSTYFDVFFSTGVLGLALVIYFLSVPVRQWQWRKKLKNNTNILILCACYFSWLIMAAVHSDIFSMSFAILFCLIVYELRQYKQINEVKQ